MAEVVTGRVLRFDQIKGYGFIAPDNGGDDVFLHVNALEGEKREYRPGVVVSFEILKDERGLKATSVRVVGGDGPPALARPVRAPAVTGSPDPADDDELLCDVVAAAELRKEIIELCLESVPSMTGEQITGLAEAMTALSRRHGWIED